MNLYLQLIIFIKYNALQYFYFLNYALRGYLSKLPIEGEVGGHLLSLIWLSLCSYKYRLCIEYNFVMTNACLHVSTYAISNTHCWQCKPYFSIYDYWTMHGNNGELDWAILTSSFAFITLMLEALSHSYQLRVEIEQL